MLEPTQEQLRDNKGVLYTRLQSVALQVFGSSSYEIDRINLRNDLASIFCERGTVKWLGNGSPLFAELPGKGSSRKPVFKISNNHSFDSG